ncbi:MAG TPA: hypothetical protein VKV27_00495 [Solirubrobacteraceae bacterium]|nr:hypothetical protein [Solirubrobacteraceae bacterium]
MNLGIDGPVELTAELDSERDGGAPPIRVEAPRQDLRFDPEALDHSFDEGSHGV